MPNENKKNLAGKTYRLKQSNTRLNPLTGLLQNFAKMKKKIQGSLNSKETIENYGLGAFPPPQDNIPKVVPKPQAIQVLPVKPLVQKSTGIFETILMLIIIYWLLRWLFGFEGTY